jgi:hypothetical protein
MARHAPHCNWKIGSFLIFGLLLSVVLLERVPGSGYLFVLFIFLTVFGYMILEDVLEEDREA